MFLELVHWTVQKLERPRTDRRTDGHYQTYNLPCFAVDNNEIKTPQRPGTSRIMHFKGLLFFPTDVMAWCYDIMPSCHIVLSGFKPRCLSPVSMKLRKRDIYIGQKITLTVIAPRNHLQNGGPLRATHTHFFSFIAKGCLMSSYGCYQTYYLSAMHLITTAFVNCMQLFYRKSEVSNMCNMCRIIYTCSL